MEVATASVHRAWALSGERWSEPRTAVGPDASKPGEQGTIPVLFTITN